MTTGKRQRLPILRQPCLLFAQLKFAVSGKDAVVLRKVVHPYSPLQALYFFFWQTRFHLGRVDPVKGLHDLLIGRYSVKQCKHPVGRQAKMAVLLALG